VGENLSKPGLAQRAYPSADTLKIRSAGKSRARLFAKPAWNFVDPAQHGNAILLGVERL